MITRVEYIITMLFWIPASLLSIAVIVLEERGSLLTANLCDIAACAVFFLFGVVRVILSSMQMNGRRFYGKRDLHDIWAGASCMLAITVLLSVGHTDRSEGLMALPPVMCRVCIGAAAAIFLYVIIKGTVKYSRTTCAISRTGGGFL